MASINQNANTSALPDFRNLGILLRILVVVNALAVGIAIARAPTLKDAWGEFVEMSGTLQPIAIVSVVVLAALNDWLQRLRYPLGAIAVVAISVGVTGLLIRGMYSAYQNDAGDSLQRSIVLALLATGVLLLY